MKGGDFAFSALYFHINTKNEKKRKKVLTKEILCVKIIKRFDERIFDASQSQNNIRRNCVTVSSVGASV